MDDRILEALEEITALLRDIRENTAMLVNNSDDLARNAPKWVDTLDSSLGGIQAEVGGLSTYL